MALPAAWSRAYARQARADLGSRNLLIQHGAAESQHLHFLQMACEKLCKAHLCHAGSDPKELQSSHAYIAKVLPIVVREQLAREGSGKARWALRPIRHLAREIELLAPAVGDAGRRPDNCEYPWEDPAAPEVVRVPVEHEFSQVKMLYEPAGRLLLKIVAKAIEGLAGE
jgi:hypothetical protein